MKLLKFKNIYLFLTIVFLLICTASFLYTQPVEVYDIKTKIHPSLTHIYTNNIKIAIMMIILAPFTLGLGTLAIIAINSATIGSVLGNIKNDLQLLWLFLPHGVLEISLLLLAATVGVDTTIQLFSMKFKKYRFLKCNLIIIIGLLISAIIETKITPLFI